MLLLLLCLFSDAVVSPIAAQTKSPVRLQLEPLSIRGRSSSALPVQIKLEYNAPQLLEGDLLLEVYNSFPVPEDLMGTIRYEGIVLQGSDYIFNTVLPPIEHSANKQYMIVAWFETASGRLSLSRDPKDPEAAHELLSIGAFERATLICSVSGRRDFQRPSPSRAYLNEALSLENYNPQQTTELPRFDDDVNRRASDTRRVQNYTCSWDAYSLPEDPLQLCCFDLVLLADGALSRLEEIQMQALQTWVAAGGSLCVLPDDERLDGSHLQFLRTLIERPSDPGMHLSITDDSELIVISEETNPVINRRFGLGRVTLLPDRQDLPALLSGETLGQVVGHLWKVRSDSGIFQGLPWGQSDLQQLLRQQGFELSRDKRGFFLQNSPERNQQYRGRRYATLEELASEFDLRYELQPRSNPLLSACETALMPQDVEMVPTSVIALLLIAYVVTIGPVDYFVLGVFRARKFTWILFPLVTGIFTALTVNIAHHYMASTDTGGRLSIVDVLENGRPVRQTDVQMHFYASQTALRVDHNQAFVVPGQMTESNSAFAPQQVPRSINRQIHYSGRFPQTFAVQQNMRQWEPQLNRTFTLTPDADDVPKISWDDPSLVTTSSGRSQLAEKLRQLADDDTQIDAIVLNGRGQLPLFPTNGYLFSSAQLRNGEQWRNTDIWRRQRMPTPQDGVVALGLLESACRQGTRDFFSIVSQVAPQGSASLEDLPLLDQTDPDQWLLMVAEKVADNITVYRRLYYVPPTPAATPDGAQPTAGPPSVGPPGSPTGTSADESVPAVPAESSGGKPAGAERQKSEPASPEQASPEQAAVEQAAVEQRSRAALIVASEPAANGARMSGLFLIAGTTP
ncbi:MAG: glycosyltransferase [Fuerstiella sp.]